MRERERESDKNLKILVKHLVHFEFAIHDPLNDFAHKFSLLVAAESFAEYHKSHSTQLLITRGMSSRPAKEISVLRKEK
jgi:hypothetical protein